ncbi:MAG: DNA-binding protein WhiA [Clostridia bacterium]|nr:DNA-binding protein WhiA [Clostridia bacterium]
MSFASDIKNELLRAESGSACCSRAELCGIICFSAGITYKNGKAALRVSTESEAAAKRFLNLIRRLFGGVDVLMGESISSGGITLFTIEIKGGADKILRELYLYDEVFDNHVSFRIRPEILECENCERAYLRGAFLGGGTATNPQKGYHLELYTHYHMLSEDTAALLTELGFPAKTTLRKSSHIIYLKGGDVIADFLASIGAFNAMMELTNIKIEKETNNDFNRANNCDIANTDKAFGAAIKQIQDIEKIKKNGKYDMLPDQLKEAAKLRLMHKELPLEALGKLFSPPLSKSGLSHRFKKIAEIAKDI